MSRVKEAAFAAALTIPVIAGCSNAEMSPQDREVQAQISSSANDMAKRILASCTEFECNFNNDSMYAYIPAADNSVNYNVRISNTESEDGETVLTEDSQVTVYAHINDQEGTHTPYEVSMQADGSELWTSCGTTTDSLTLGEPTQWQDSIWIKTHGRLSGQMGDEDMVFNGYYVDAESAATHTREAAQLADVLLDGAAQGLGAEDLQKNIIC